LNFYFLCDKPLNYYSAFLASLRRSSVGALLYYDNSIELSLVYLVVLGALRGPFWSQRSRRNTKNTKEYTDLPLEFYNARLEKFFERHTNIDIDNT